MEGKKHKETIITIAAGFLLIYFIFDVLIWLRLAFIMLLIGLLSNALSRYIHIAWFWIAEKMGYVMSRLILGVSFILIVIPIALLSRLFRKDIMIMKQGRKSYYKERNHRFGENDLIDPW